MAEFIKVMEIKERFCAEMNGNHYPWWYKEAFCSAEPSKDQFETAERELLTWDAAQKKEEQPVESKRTRVHELLGVEVYEVFGIKSKGGEFRIDENGEMQFKNQSGNFENVVWSFLLAQTINDPSLIIRRPTLTDEQREVLVWLHKFEFGYVAADDDGEVCAYRYEPELETDQWVLTDDGDPFFASSAFACLRPLIPDWTKPLDVEKALRNAGVEV